MILGMSYVNEFLTPLLQCNHFFPGLFGNVCIKSPDPKQTWKAPHHISKTLSISWNPKLQKTNSKSQPQNYNFQTTITEQNWENNTKNNSGK